MTERKTGTPELRRFHRALYRWYQSHGRTDLPWRRTDDPYAIYVSEVMLQQTQVKTVLERFYFPFLQRFPSLRHLARASEASVLSAWQGLGYYSRARNLHKAAIQCEGKLPHTLEGLLALPGVGRNTAHAILALAYQKPVAVMEANLRRVLSRIFAHASPSGSELWRDAHHLLDPGDPFTYNQAMMDLGALLCTPQQPACDQCPASSICKGRQKPEHYPASKKRKKVAVRHQHIWLLRNRRGEYYATPRTTRFLGGLFHFPETTADSASPLPHHKHTLRHKEQLGEIRQTYSHFELQAVIWHAEAGTASGADWHSPEALLELPFSAAEKKILRLLAQYRSATP